MQNKQLGDLMSNERIHTSLRETMTLNEKCFAAVADKMKPQTNHAM